MTWLKKLLVLLVIAGASAGGLNGGGAEAPRANKILHRFLDEFVDITPGRGQFPATFVMGSQGGPAAEQPAHKVVLAHAFALAKFEVTQELYEVVMGKNPSRWKGPRNSVEMVHWAEANAFCAQTTKVLHAHGLLKDKEWIRLPTEAEWEYVCRAGTTGSYSFGDAAKDLGMYAWFTGNAKGNDPPVGAKKPNPWGLYDMHGYVWEWCADAWRPNYQDAHGNGKAGAKERVLRGGAWTEVADHCRSAYRHHVPAETRSAAIGFRCLKTSQAKPGKD